MDINLRLAQWTRPPFDEETQKEVKKLKAQPELAEDAFYKDLEFGTGGMRGIMGVGTNRINKYTLGKNSQGLADYLKILYPNEKISIVIAYDCRNQSRELAHICAEVFTANEIHCALFTELRPTPQLSFAVRYLKAHCGIVLTASHNPPEYNGYKVYGQDGGQLVPPHDKALSKQIQNTKFEKIKFEGNQNFLTLIDAELDDAYRKDVLKSARFSKKQNKPLKIVFTPIHGTSITILPDVLSQAGFDKVSLVKEQTQPDGNFPTVVSPNPEEKEALKLAVALGTKNNADLVIGTDPDADRFGLVVRDTHGQWKYLNGNQIMAVLTDFLLDQKKIKNQLDTHCFIASTIVSSPLIEEIAKSYQVQYKATLTGFKWIAKLIEEYPDLKFIGGGEESFGYLVGDSVRDKDAISASLLACEIANEAKLKGSSFYQLLIECYKKYGAYKERLVSITKKGKAGMTSITKQMDDFRTHPPKEIGGFAVCRLEDYQQLTTYDFEKQLQEQLNFPASNVLIFTLENGSKIALRPSGTEPKIKYYFSVSQNYNLKLDWEQQEQQLDHKLDHLISSFLPE